MPRFSLTFHYRYVATIVLCSVLLSACSTRNDPAPVIGMYGGVPLKERVKNSITTSEYIVKKGETLYSIAWRANSDVRQIAQLNKISSPYRIFPGQKLFLTEKSPKKTTEDSKNKPSTKKSSKGSSTANKKSTKKVLATTKKQAYGKNVTGGKVYQKSIPENKGFSQKIHRWQWPVKGKVIDYFSNQAQGNKGIDIAGRRGTNIKAAADGKVVYAGDALRGYGKLIIIKHNDDYLSAYAHNDKLLVKEQQVVKGGKVIAKMGDTDSVKVMLHFEIRFRGKSINPLKYLPKK
ncbi:peptidoglycan DD-metalloendopeptidase family protein [Colwellia sp. D2M02]|uniref:peptidoglycan DD-metalloendopeptidase family protein n=1 Tax=Colwellia sp. D2M02 TaxID=2841562 RepID=UPI001C086D95|nr:peptidoglycan DD-metalloendopeptidase family protein [Colwellia sp. D2M02]MBU2894321.1 peptidoglycan DD-metalloendopeptidase family protein [Colwellia sp. D2M02]